MMVDITKLTAQSFAVSIFIVFFFLFKNEQVPIKVSKHLKIPYAYNSLDLSRIQCRHYKGVCDGLYYVKSYDCRTYFYCKNNLIAYDRKHNYEVAIFMYDFIKGSHKLVKPSKLEGIIRDERVFFISVNDQIRFVVSRDTELRDRRRYITVNDVHNGRFLLKAVKEKEINIELLPFFCYSILPIIQFRIDGIFVYLVDLLSENSYIMSWYPNDIKALINASVKADEDPLYDITIKNTILQDNITSIKYAEIHTNSIREYIIEENTDNDNNNHSNIFTFMLDIKGKSEAYIYNLKSLIINIEWNKDKLTGILKFKSNESEVRVSKNSTENNLVYSVKTDDRALSSLLLINSLTRTYKIRKVSDSEISKLAINVQGEIIYSDGLYYLLRHRGGIEITKISKYNKNELKYDLSSIYRYKQYIFIINRFPKVKLFVIDTKKI